ncbi:MAG TPA: helix-turn-helix domain-containing protein [Solirubrobacterales bacterium]|nr:helix-turn-helix domain-containing protein [Solirubrobacterales bacterium]
MPPQDGFPQNGHTSNGDSTAMQAENGHNGKRSSVPVNWEHLARATAHPLRVSILEILGIDGGRVLSPSDLSRELQIPLSNTNYHVTELAKSGLIELVRERQVRGATEHFYRLPGAGEAQNGAEQRAEDSERAWAMA